MTITVRFDPLGVFLLLMAVLYLGLSAIDVTNGSWAGLVDLLIGAFMLSYHCAEFGGRPTPEEREKP